MGQPMTRTSGRPPRGCTRSRRSSPTVGSWCSTSARQGVSESHGEPDGRVGWLPHPGLTFTAQWDRFGHGSPRRACWRTGTHLRGGGSWDAATASNPRITVTLATAYSGRPLRTAQTCGYRDPPHRSGREWAKDPDTMVVPQRGEVCTGLRTPNRPRAHEVNGEIAMPGSLERTAKSWT